MLKAILFDLDGTLIDSEEYYKSGTYTWIKRKGIDVNIEDIYSIIGLSIEDTYKKIVEITGLEYDDVKRTNENYFNKECPLDFNEWIFPETKDTFKMLKDKGLKIAICSMSPTFYIKKFGDDTGLSEYIDYYISGEECKNTKPDPEIYLKALKELNILPSEAIVVEDAKSGILAGKAAGIKVIARDASRYKIDQSKADLIIKDLNDLENILF